MRRYKNIQFGEGINITLADFETQFEVLLVGLSKSEIKEAYKIATDGNITASVRQRKDTSKPEIVADSVHSEDGDELHDAE